MLWNLFLKIFFALIFKSSIFQSSFVYSFLWFLFYSIWSYTILIMYIFNLKILVCSNACFKFVKSCNALCNVVNSNCVLWLSVRGLFTNTPSFWRHNELLIVGFRFAYYSNFSFIVSPTRGCICKETSHIQSLTLN